MLYTLKKTEGEVDREPTVPPKGPHTLGASPACENLKTFNCAINALMPIEYFRELL